MADGPRFSTRPLYLRVRDHVLERITAGIWRPGTILPAEVDLARELGVSSGTVRKALDALESERVVSRRQGKGTFVNDSTAQELAWRYDNIRSKTSARLAGHVGTSKVRLVPSSRAEQEQLQLEEGERVIRIHRVMQHDGRPYMFEEASLPAKFFERLAERESAPQTIVDLALEFGIVLGRGVESVSVGVANESVAAALSIASGAPVLRLDRVVFAIDGRPLEWRVANCHLAEERYVVEFA